MHRVCRSDRTRILSRYWHPLSVLLAFLPFAPKPLPAIQLPEGFADESVFTGLVAPTALAFAPDGRVFVAEKSGIIKVFPNVQTPTASIFADLRTQVHNAEDRGLLEIKLDPQFPSSPYLYVAYTLDAEIGEDPPRWGERNETSDPCPSPQEGGCPASARLSRLTVSGNVMSGTELVLVENWCQHFPSHSIGGIAFDSTGALYIGAGDGANPFDIDYGHSGRPANVCGDPPGRSGRALSPPDAMGGSLRSQNLDLAGYDRATYDGKVLRLNRANGDALPDNPLFGSPVEGADRIVARGLRQPFRLAVRPGTNEIWWGDVGWGEYEEINRLQDPTAGVKNYGWPCFEGPQPQAAYSFLGLDACEILYDEPSSHQPPFFSYSHTASVVPGDGCPAGTSAITGLTFYQGRRFPRPYDGALFFADYGRSCIWVMQSGVDGAPDPATLRHFAGDVASPIDLQAGLDGSLYYIDIFGGSVRRIAYVVANVAPTAAIQADVTSGPLPLTVRFDASGSTDPNGDALTYRWDFNGDGSVDSTDASPQFTYEQVGNFVATLVVSDARGGVDEAEVEILAGQTVGPTARITKPAASLRWKVGDRIDFEGIGQDSSEGSLPRSAFHWSLLLHHCPISGCHMHLLQDFDGVRSDSYVTSTHEYPSHIELVLTVTNSAGQTATDRILLYPETAELTVESQPSGLSLGAGAEARQAPFSQTVMAQSLITISAPSPQRVGCRQYEFASWSDGGERSHEIRVPTSGSQVVATFVPLDDGPCTLPCAGDCNGDGQVPVDELITAVSIAVGQQTPPNCVNADLNGDGAVTVDEILSAVTAALGGCDGGAP